MWYDTNISNVSTSVSDSRSLSEKSLDCVVRQVIQLSTISISKSIRDLHHFIRIDPENRLQRYQAALIIDRALRLYSLYDGREITTPTYTPYTDNNLWDSELDTTLIQLQKYGIMKWSNTSFEPTKDLKWEQLLALLWRIFYWLSDNGEGKRYDGYVEYFTDTWIIDSNRWYIEKSIPRKEVFLLFAKILKLEGVL